MLLNGKRVVLSQLEAELTAAGVAVPHHLGLAGDDLHTYDAAGAAAELPAGAAAVVAAHVPPPLPTSPNYGADLMTDEQAQAQAATLVQNLRQYIGLASPTLAQTNQATQALSKIAIYLIRQRFPGL